MRRRQRRRRKASVLRYSRWNFQPKSEAYSQPSPSASACLCYKENRVDSEATDRFAGSAGLGSTCALPGLHNSPPTPHQHPPDGKTWEDCLEEGPRGCSEKLLQ